MKKILIVLFILLIPITVKAADYELDFQSPLIHTNYTGNQFYKNGYLFVDSSYEYQSSTMINYYGADGNLIKLKIFDNYTTYAVKIDNDYIYLLGYLNSRKTFYKIDENLEIIAEFEVDEYDELRHSDFNDDFIIEDNKIIAMVYYYETGESKVFKMDIDFQNYRLEEMNQNNYPELIIYNKLNEDEEKFNTNVIKVGDYFYALYRIRIYNEADGIYHMIPHIAKYNSNYELLWDKEYEDYYGLDKLLSFNDDIYLLSYDQSQFIENSTEKSGLLKMDKDGNILGKVIPDTSIDGVAIDKDNILVSSGTYRYCLDANVFEIPDECMSSIYHKVYSLEYKIETKTDGNGEIKAIQNSKPGVGITFEVIPKKGYVLSEVKVTDSEGNTVTFTDNKFTMPSSDVTIEAVFVPANPNTKDLINICIIVFIISAVAYILSSTIKRKKLI